jgi:ABC-type dipeptide/oligopeptide/nickel transport system ATPase component
MATGIEKIARERSEQLTIHNRTHGHDQEINKNQELRQAAIYCLTLNDLDWPITWATHYAHKIAGKSYEERMVVAGALLAAEIDRLILADDYQRFLQNQAT